eukprot:CAMPEP_0172360958 /NCGR_PEP_ID=MMETSP1060-20121228/4884_1 /TAXON_ID=37318 /ORGANISM="Pseudo-nitzschia pungens, Strain cf. cingulata" /LENGTH=271 /DNA_ID=CAMNT_0013083083 /DNA_START=57 /DNA_END=872 /DNA_ORIENTATION=-
MKTFASYILALAGSTAAFAPSAHGPRASVKVQESVAEPVPETIPESTGYETKADLEELAKKLNPIVGFYDPLNLAEAEFWGQTNEQTIGFLRHAEIKHGRVAMFAFVGYLVHANGIRWPWAMMLDGTPFPEGNNPPELWDQIPDNSKWQIFGLILFLELWSEISTDDHKHYMRGGKPGDFPDFDTVALPHPVPFNLFDPFKLSKRASDEKKARGLEIEINNGRLAMLGIFGFLSEATIPGSVPTLKDIVQPYAGEVMAPFTANMLDPASLV